MTTLDRRVLVSFFQSIQEENIWKFLSEMRGKKLSEREKGFLLSRMEEILVRSICQSLIKEGGWSHRTFFRGNAIKRGRLWDRDLPKFQISKEFLLDLLQESPRLQPYTEGDMLANLLCLRRLHQVDYIVAQSQREENLKRYNEKTSNMVVTPLLALFQPNVLNAFDAPDFSVLVRESPWMVEGLFLNLRDFWVGHQKALMEIKNPVERATAARKQEAVLSGFLTACEKYERKDLAAWVLEVAERTLKLFPDPESWTRSLDQTHSFKELEDARDRSMLILRALNRFEAWNAQARNSMEFDDDFHFQQIVLENAKRMALRNDDTGMSGFERARYLQQEIVNLPLVRG